MQRILGDSDPRNKGRAASQASFVGREKQLQLLADRLHAAAAGDGGVLLIAGEPGVGKTRLLRETADRARDAGWRVLGGQSYDSEGMPPYLPFIEALQDYVRDCPLDELTAQLGGGAPEVALILPEVSRRLPDLPSNVSIDPQSDRYRLFERTSDFLIAIARAAPAGLLLCLDDLHWADDSSLLLLEQVARRSATAPLIIVVTYRDTDLDVARPLARTLEQLARQALSQRVDLKRLDKEDVGLLLGSLGRPDPPAALVEAVFNETEGNPFFVQEMFHYLAGEGRLFDGQGGWLERIHVAETDVPQGVRLVIGRRLERLSDDCRRLLALASVIGRTFSYDLLRSIADLDENALFDALDEAQSSHLLAPAPDGRLAFGHELVRQTLLAGHSLPRRQRMHERIAEAMEQLHAGDAEPPLVEIASHYCLAGSAAEWTKATDYASRAGDRAVAVLAFEEALRLYEMALDAMELRGAGPEQKAAAAELHAKRGETFVSLNRQAEARPEFEAAIEGLNGARRVEVLLELASICSAVLRDDTAAHRFAKDASELTQVLDREDLAGAALAMIAGLEVGEGHLTASLAKYRQAAALAGDLRSRLLSRVFWAFPLYLYIAGELEEAVVRGREAVATFRAAKDPLLLAELPNLGLALAASGLYDQALRAFEEAHQFAREYRAAVGPGFLSWPLVRAIGMSAEIHIDTYDFAGAEALAWEARDLARSANWRNTEVSAGIDLLFIHARRHDPGRAEALIGDVADAMRRLPAAHPFLWQTRFPEAQAELALARGDWQAAVDFADDVAVQSETMSQPKYVALALSTRGKALLGLQRKREAIADLRRAVDVARPVGDPAMFLAAAAALLAVEADGPLAVDARAAADRILENLSDVEMRSAFEAAEPVQLVYKLTGPKSGRPALQRPVYPDGLSEREVEVLRLIATGKSNQQIADDLVISLNTVFRHVSNIFGKSGAANRTEAAAYAHRHNLS